jgi:hypothetical protein
MIGLVNDGSIRDDVGTPAELNKTTKLPTAHVQAEATIPLPTSWSKRCYRSSSSGSGSSSSSVDVDGLHRGLVDITGHPVMYAIEAALRTNGHPVCHGRCVHVPTNNPNPTQPNPPIDGTTLYTLCSSLPYAALRCAALLCLALLAAVCLIHVCVVVCMVMLCCPLQGWSQPYQGLQDRQDAAD